MVYVFYEKAIDFFVAQYAHMTITYCPKGVIRERSRKM